MAMRGLRPIAEIQYLDYLMYALMDVVVDNYFPEPRHTKVLIAVIIVSENTIFISVSLVVFTL